MKHRIKFSIYTKCNEYEKIWTDDLAMQRAEYELYLHARLNDTITLKSVPVYWLDVNQKIEYVNKDINLVPQKWNVQTQQYDLPSHFITKNIQMGLGPGATMTVKAMRFYPLYPFWGTNTPVTPPQPTIKPVNYTVKTPNSVINIRSGPGTNFEVVGQIKSSGVYTIIGEASGQGATKWLQLKSGAGWISADVVTKL